MPRNALFLSAVMLLSSIVLLYAGDSISSAFNLVTTVAPVLVIFAWAMIMVSYLMYRRSSRHVTRSRSSVCRRSFLRVAVAGCSSPSPSVYFGYG